MAGCLVLLYDDSGGPASPVTELNKECDAGVTMGNLETYAVHVSSLLENSFGTIKEWKAAMGERRIRRQGREGEEYEQI